MLSKPRQAQVRVAPPKRAFAVVLKEHLQKMLLGGKFKHEELHSIPKELKLDYKGK